MNFLPPAETLQFAEMLGLLFSNPDCGISPECEALALKTHFGPLLYWFAVQRKHAVSAEIERAFTSAAALQMVHETELKKFYDCLEQAEISFVPVKGIDLAFRIYPVPALRLFKDWDIWIEKSDRKRLNAALTKEGWHCPLDCFSEHHWGGWEKGRFLLEPHFSLPNFSGIAPRELWELTAKTPGRNFQRNLSGSLNLILLFQHNSAQNFQQNRLLKLLVDTEFLLRTGTVDWNLVSEYVRRWHLPHPGLLLAAFPEFFRDRWGTGITFPQKMVSALRNLLLFSWKLRQEREGVNVVAARPFDLAWYREQLQHLRRENLQWQYRLHGAGVFRCWCCLGYDLLRKIGLLIHHRVSPEAQQLLKQKKMIEGSWKSAPDATGKKGSD